jgi:hypothetical protein
MAAAARAVAKAIKVAMRVAGAATAAVMLIVARGRQLQYKTVKWFFWGWAVAHFDHKVIFVFFRRGVDVRYTVL